MKTSTKVKIEVSDGDVRANGAITEPLFSTQSEIILKAFLLISVTTCFCTERFRCRGPRTYRAMYRNIGTSHVVYLRPVTCSIITSHPLSGGTVFVGITIVAFSAELNK